MNELLVVTPNGYKTSKLYSVVPANGTGDLTWVRNTTATRVNSSGLIESVGANVPRLDYTGGVTCPCILVEPLRTNSLTYSEQFDNAAWNKAFLNTTGTPAWVDQAAAPDGTTTAEKIIPSNATNIHSIRRVNNVAATNTYTFSIFAKKGEYKNILVWFDNHSGGIGVNLDNGTVFRNVNNIGYTIENYGNGWWRISTTATITVTSGTAIYVYDNSATPSIFFTGNNSDGLYIWGAQLETASTVTSYIPTVASIQTRNADVATVTTPVGITSLIETYEDNTTNVVNPIPVTYQMSEGRIAKVVGL